MPTCVIVAALITCTGVAPRPTPAEAVAVLTGSVRPYVAIPRWPVGPQMFVVRNTPTFPDPPGALAYPWPIGPFPPPASGYFGLYSRPYGRAYPLTRPVDLPVSHARRGGRR